jgi:hypothetical protein
MRPEVTRPETKAPLACWQDWAIFALALWLAVSPWLADYASQAAATANAAVAGLAIALAAHYEASCETSIEWLNLAAGAWLIAAPFALGFQGEGVPAATSVAVGAAIAALAASALELDRSLSRFVASRHLIRR